MYFVADGGKKCELLMRVQLDKIICAQEALSMFQGFHNSVAGFRFFKHGDGD